MWFCWGCCKFSMKTILKSFQTGLEVSFSALQTNGTRTQLPDCGDRRPIIRWCQTTSSGGPEGRCVFFTSISEPLHWKQCSGVDFLVSLWRATVLLSVRHRDLLGGRGLGSHRRPQGHGLGAQGRSHLLQQGVQRSGRVHLPGGPRHLPRLHREKLTPSHCFHCAGSCWGTSCTVYKHIHSNPTDTQVLQCI